MKCVWCGEPLTRIPGNGYVHAEGSADMVRCPDCGWRGAPHPTPSVCPRCGQVVVLDHPALLDRRETN